MATRAKIDEQVSLRRKPLITIAVLLLMVVLGYAARHVEHHVYAMDFFVGKSQAAVETWSLDVAGRYEFVYWKSNPKSPQDGLRLLRPN